jgi:hypothetical protein
MASSGAIERNNKIIKNVRRNYQKRLALKIIIKDKILPGIKAFETIPLSE